MTVSIHPPATLVAGDSWAWEAGAVFEDHPDPWAASYVLRPEAGGDPVTVSGGLEVLAPVFRLPASVTADLPPGEWTWFAVAVDATTDARAVLAQGRVTVIPDPLAGTEDRRTPARRILAAIEATLEGRATKDADTYSIEGRSITRTPLPDLLRLRAVYAEQVARETGRSPYRQRRVSF
ncbi:head-to-tail joining protein [Dinoroseobacter phage vB_DshS-R4C]|uniref:Head-to-tail joining protein n=1 Tax=Dinoroseobacter phage vB_DshS-R4C TaxID=2590919 RepID=A0ACD6BAB0_9CAUD|nr:Chain M, Head-to-tail joining protein [Dinoroseobacter phage vB_DshS-R4C]8GTD_N Chain N, Head-to-tail joining protein [Dinoroseobacter phage vB_DshS-R4C]8GTD_O Chain O, Head-to-tail joining protein [Dinoroseobacter phage vB_DshS-R4C]8GTD_P Chain P, Head-to-tail joining protein [Dinoroseobacter phage vB_DshS-R4C]8GTD_Q Chain Q, Head-to-tail joining protein [Dinoroseobacter phage vB_DshS-R4C]8GTD_R Chain R, Head-to-tail joining protein [Dinoroseobacter phage vB_DshS-R4C]8GTD_S Chain S, Head-